MIHNTQVGYKNFNLSEQVSTYILNFFKVSQVLSRMCHGHFLKLLHLSPKKKA